jgi:hypothetical protein
MYETKKLNSLQNRRKIFASYTSKKGLVTRIYRELQKPKFPKNQWPNEKNGQMN